MKDKGETQRRVCGGVALLFTVLMCMVLFLSLPPPPPPPQVCIIPQSAHGTNPASAQMAGLKIVQVPTKSDGSTSVEDFKKLVSLFCCFYLANVAKATTYNWGDSVCLWVCGCGGVYNMYTPVDVCACSCLL